MPFLQLTLDAPSGEAERIEAACFDAGALAVSLADAGDAPIFEPGPGETPLWSHVQVTALFAASREPREVVDALQAALGRALPAHRFEELADRAWEREWLKDFRPLRFGARLWVCPHGQLPPEVEPSPVIVWLDPGLAFGTGTHPTTAMCLEWLDGAKLHDREVIDYGCGSGILAIAAVKLGARHVLGVDLDPQALLATTDNAERNEVAERIRVGKPDAAREPVDFLVANILSEPLIELAPRFAALVRPGGALALSGILEAQAAAVTLAYAPWFDMRTFATRDSWVCLNGERR
ncbi:MAG TPA: 50S ribosomal protein L11 methyltransferase [Steroidobacteraceae bacterium]|nr:50S ribosomal protein L11 methyltransferase [Steroidobacteraceae bacterium]